MTLTYYGPLGDIRESLDEIESLVAQAGEEYWSAGSGTGLLSLGAIGSSPSLIIMVKDPYGVALQADVGEYEYCAVGDENAPASDVSIIVGGDPMEIPRRCFVSRRQAWAAIQEFAATGQLPETLRWARKEEIMP